MIEKKIDGFISHIESHKKTIRHNHQLFDIYEGDLLPYVEKALAEQLSSQTFAQAQKRISPINVLIKIVDKLSKIYQQNPTRSVIDGTPSDVELLSYYEECFKMNATMNISNEFFNLYKNNLLQIFLHQGKPRLRSIPSDRFLAFSDDAIDPQNPTNFLLIHGEEKNEMGMPSNLIYHAWSDEEFVIFDSEGKVRRDMMRELGNEGGENPIGKMPFVYVNRSPNLIVPKIDTDTLRMTILIPTLLSDLNVASMFQSFSILYGVDVDDENLVMAPNAFWRFKSDTATDNKPEIGSIKPDTDIDSVLKLIQSQLAFWLQSRGIRPGAVGQLGAENFASGVSKMVDEMDSTDDRKRQVDFFEDAEAELWDLVINHAHPYWVGSGQIEQTAFFSPSAAVQVNFAQQVPVLNRKQVIEEVILEIEGGLLSKKDAIKRLDPHLSDAEVDEKMAAIDSEENQNLAKEIADALQARKQETETQTTAQA